MLLPTGVRVCLPGTGNMIAKTNSYEHIIREVEHSTLTPLVIASTECLAREANTFYNRLVSLLTMVWKNSYSSTLY